ncbi:MAG TPA: DNA polymerase III subunit gamma and tau [Mycobacteriales bacterium]|nr:DNA polymerase III subunit gamma and tau [Mycobacteriales bacterium]
MALALYRKYRPATFAEVIGQDHVTEPLAQALRSGRINHAYLFSGPRGCGKTSSARILARSLNCVKGPTPEPCGVCDSCVALAPDGPGSLDVIEIDAASHGGVDDARDLRERAFFAPVSSRYKVYIVDEAHMVSTQGFNALLKLVEEPPDFLVFVFATTEPDKVLPTIRSRTHHYPFRLMPPGKMRGLLEQICTAEAVKVEPPVYPVVVRAGGGSARDSLSVMDQLLAGAGAEGVTYARAVALLGVTDAALLDEIVDALAAGDRAAVYQTVDKVVDAGHDPRRFAVDLLERLRDLVILDAVPDAVTKGLLDGPADQFDRMTDQAARLGTATLSRLADIVHTGLVEMRGTTSPRLLLELLCARMMLPAASGEDGAVLQRLERLERRLTMTGAAPVEAAPAGPRAAAVGPRAAPAGDDRRAPADAAATERPAEPAARSAAGRAASGGGSGRAGGNAPGRAADAASGQPSGGAPGQPEDGSSRAAGGRPGQVPDGPGRASDGATGRGPAADQGAAAARPAQPAAPQRPAPVPAGEIDAAAVRRIWPEVLEAVKRRRRTTHALLMNVSVQSVGGGLLTLAISSEPLSRLLGEELNLECVRGAVRDVLGVDWRVKVQVDGGTAAGGGRAGAAEPPPDDPRDDDPGYQPGAPAASPPPRADPEQAAISLLESTLGARRIDPTG